MSSLPAATSAAASVPLSGQSSGSVPTEPNDRPAGLSGPGIQSVSPNSSDDAAWAAGQQLNHLRFELQLAWLLPRRGHEQIATQLWDQIPATVRGLVTLSEDRDRLTQAVENAREIWDNNFDSLDHAESVQHANRDFDTQMEQGISGTNAIRDAICLREVRWIDKLIIAPITQVIQCVINERQRHLFGLSNYIDQAIHRNPAFELLVLPEPERAASISNGWAEALNVRTAPSREPWYLPSLLHDTANDQVSHGWRLMVEQRWREIAWPLSALPWPEDDCPTVIPIGQAVELLNQRAHEYFQGNSAMSAGDAMQGRLLLGAAIPGTGEQPATGQAAGASQTPAEEPGTEPNRAREAPAHGSGEQLAASKAAGAARPAASTGDGPEREGEVPPGYLGLIVDREQYTVRRQGPFEMITIERKLTFDFLVYFVGRRDKWTSLEELKDVWRDSSGGDMFEPPLRSVIDSALWELRRTIHSLGLTVTNRRRMGWRLTAR